jgi:hypothetical protein
MGASRKETIGLPRSVGPNSNTVDGGLLAHIQGERFVWMMEPHWQLPHEMWVRLTEMMRLLMSSVMGPMGLFLFQVRVKAWCHSTVDDRIRQSGLSERSKYRGFEKVARRAL